MRTKTSQCKITGSSKDLQTEDAFRAVDCSVAVRCGRLRGENEACGENETFGTRHGVFSTNTDRNKGSMLYTCTLRGMGAGKGKSRKVMGLYANTSISLFNYPSHLTLGCNVTNLELYSLNTLDFVLLYLHSIKL